jgi:hypothetical protein
MATFAALVRGSAVGIERCFPVRRTFKTVVKSLMAGLARLGTHVLGMSPRVSTRWLLGLTQSQREGCKETKDKDKDESERPTLGSDE